MQNNSLSSLITILYVDDEPSMSDIAHYFLEEKLGGCRVTSATEVSIALELLKNQPFDAIVADYEMPDLDGLDLLRLLRQKGDTTPFIVCTGKSRHEVVIEALNAGADFYLQKGEDPLVLFTEMKQMIVQTVSRRRSEKALAKSRHLLEEIIDFLPDATLSIDNAYRVIAWNRIMEELTGISSEQILGKTLEHSVFRFNDTTIDGLIRTILEKDASYESRKEMLLDRNRVITEEFRGHFNGEEEKECFFRITVSPILDSDMKKVGLIGSIRDITEQKRSEYAVLESRENYRALVENNQDIVMRFNRKGKHLYVNPAITRYIPINPEEFIGKTYSELQFPQEAYIEWDNIIQQVISSGYPVETDVTFHSLKGEVTFNWRLFPEFDMKGDIRSVLSISRDITYQKQFEREKQTLLSQIERNLGEFAILNDGIRNPLAVITGWLSIMESLQEKEREILMSQIKLIDEMITQLDRRWVESEKVLGFLRRHYSIQSTHPDSGT